MLWDTGKRTGGGQPPALLGDGDQNRPEILPVASTSIRSAAGTLGRPGMVMISPVRATRNPAPADTLILRTVTVKPVGAPQLVPESDSRKPYSDAASDFNDTSSNQY